MLYNEFMGLKIELLLNYEYSFVLNMGFFVGFFFLLLLLFYFLFFENIRLIRIISIIRIGLKKK